MENIYKQKQKPNPNTHANTSNMAYKRSTTKNERMC